MVPVVTPSARADVAHGQLVPVIEDHGRPFPRGQCGHCLPQPAAAFIRDQRRQRGRRLTWLLYAFERRPFAAHRPPVTSQPVLRQPYCDGR